MTPVPVPVIWTVYGIVFFGLLAGLALVRRALRQTAAGWSLADALSEEAELSVDSQGLPYNVNGVVVKKTVLVASTSRIIALVGMLVIVSMFVGFGLLELWQFAQTGTLPATTDVLKFLVGGGTLFAPYLFNKVASAVS